MLLPYLLALGLLGFMTSIARADDAISPETISAIKAATVYIRMEGGDGWGGSGSGFVVAADKDRVLVVTNHHVAVRSPNGSRAKPPKVSVVFGSGTKSEREYPATVVASDEDRDLAVLRVTDVKETLQPLSYANPPQPVETMNVLSFGFPFGQALVGHKGFPSVTVGKASISNLRNGDDGELEAIQIDGNLNPGNSGGPVVDAKGRLIGVAVARVREGQGIGLLIPASEVARLMDGRIGRVRVEIGRGTETTNARVDAEMLDPLGKLKAASAYYVFVPDKGKFPSTTPLNKHPDAQKITMRVNKGSFLGEFAVENRQGSVVVQVVGEREDGTLIPARSRIVPVGVPAKPRDFTRVPGGWKEYLSRNNRFTVWLPVKPRRQSEGHQEIPLSGASCTVNSVTGVTADGLAYRIEVIDVPIAVGQLNAQVHQSIRAALKSETKGHITDVTEIRQGPLGGVEYRIESGNQVTRARVFVKPQLVYIIRIGGTVEQIITAEAEIILGSFRERTGKVLVRDRHEANTKDPKLLPISKEPSILGSVQDPVFKTMGPAGALLIGIEVRIGRFGGTEITRAMRPIYRVDGKEIIGTQYGNDLSGSNTLKAKEGYAVGGVTGKCGFWCNGFSFTYMKVKPDGTLDPEDSYESEWIGSDGDSDKFKIISEGEPVIGIVGKFVRDETTAFGLLFKRQEGFEPNSFRR